MRMGAQLCTTLCSVAILRLIFIATIVVLSFIVKLNPINDKEVQRLKILKPNNKWRLARGKAVASRNRVQSKYISNVNHQLFEKRSYVTLMFN